MTLNVRTTLKSDEPLCHYSCAYQLLRKHLETSKFTVVSHVLIEKIKLSSGERNKQVQQWENWDQEAEGHISLWDWCPPLSILFHRPTWLSRFLILIFDILLKKYFSLIAYSVNHSALENPLKCLCKLREWSDKTDFISSINMNAKYCDFKMSLIFHYLQEKQECWNRLHSWLCLS